MRHTRRPIQDMKGVPMISNDDMKKIREEMELCFVPREECTRNCEKFRVQLADNKSDFSVIKFQLKLILGILGAIGTAVLSLVVSTVWG